MSAGSSPDTGKSGIKGFVIPITKPPVVEIDTEATAAYIRLRDTAVIATKPFGSEKGLVMLDFDADENVVGIDRMTGVASKHLTFGSPSTKRRLA
jgi:uncharacterized protein YuzE